MKIEMDERLRELLDRLVAKGKFPNMSASEGHEIYELVYELWESYEELSNKPVKEKAVAQINFNKEDLDKLTKEAAEEFKQKILYGGYESIAEKRMKDGILITHMPVDYLDSEDACHVLIKICLNQIMQGWKGESTNYKGPGIKELEMRTFDIVLTRVDIEALVSEIKGYFLKAVTKMLYGDLE